METANPPYHTSSAQRRAVVSLLLTRRENAEKMYSSPLFPHPQDTPNIGDTKIGDGNRGRARAAGTIIERLFQHIRQDDGQHKQDRAQDVEEEGNDRQRSPDIPGQRDDRRDHRDAGERHQDP